MFPFRTQKLISHTPTILGWQRPGKIGSRRIPFRSASLEALFSLLPRHTDQLSPQAALCACTKAAHVPPMGLSGLLVRAALIQVCAFTADFSAIIGYFNIARTKVQRTILSAESIFDAP